MKTTKRAPQGKQILGILLIVSTIYVPLVPRNILTYESQVNTVTEFKLTGVTHLAAGSRHTCVVVMSGGVKCWGSNNSWELGDGTQINRSQPVDNIWLPNDVSMVSAGNSFTCALTTFGGVKCWGSNLFGHLGDRTLNDSPYPVDVIGLSSNVKSISLGSDFACALLFYGGVKCWGGNFNDGTGLPSPQPPLDIGLSGISAISVGSRHACVLTDSGGIKCWGANYAGQLGNGTTDVADSSAAVNVIGLSSNVKDISVSTGSHTCALMDSGSVKCWGANYAGQLGNGTMNDSLIPVDVIGLSSGAVAVSSGGSHVCALMNNRKVKCWGNNSVGQLGNGKTGDALTPLDVNGLSGDVLAISAGENHTCALIVDGGIQCWGANNGSIGTLGVGDRSTSNKPEKVLVGLPSFDIVNINSGYGFTCVATAPGDAKCWGSNGASTQMILSNVSSISVGHDYSCLVTKSNDGKCWGTNWLGQLGNGTTQDSYWQLVNVWGLFGGVANISAKESHSCALMIAGSVKCWGSNSFGQLGNGATGSYSLIPVNVIGLTGVSNISVGDQHSCAIVNQGVKCWGNNSAGQLGTGTYVNSTQPTDVLGLSTGILAISAGYTTTCAVTSYGGIKCWGGQYGPQPVDIDGLTSGILNVSSGQGFICVLMNTGSVKCWGNNSFGELGNGTMMNSAQPVDVLGISDAVAITAGDQHACVLMATNDVKCWGRGTLGELGNGYLYSAFPLDVISGESSSSEGTPTPTPTPNYTQETLPPPLPRGCIGGGTPINYNNDTCCVKGFVYVNGIPVSGAAVAVNYNGQIVTGTTAVSSDSSQPYFAFSLNEAPLYVPVNGSFTITATYGGQSKSVSAVALAGSQQVDIALPGNSSQPVATINKITPLDAKQGAGSINFYGSGMDPDATNVIAQYEWKIINATTGFSVTNNTANFVISASSLTDVGTYTVTFRVQDDEGAWSGVVKQTLLVRNAQGGLTSGNTWTILIYADGDNNLGGSLGDVPGGMVRKLINLGSTPNVNVFGWYDGPKIGDSFEFQKYSSGWFQKTALGEKRMDEQATLLNFITAGMNAFPSDHVMLILADHANGIVGIAQDLSSDGTGRAFITPIELRTAVQQATLDGTRKLDVVVFDGCSFGQFEDIAAMDGLADYLVASPNTGWGVFPYDVYRSLASQSPVPAVLAQQIAQTYAARVSSYLSLPYTIAAYDLSRFNQAKEAIGGLGNALVSYVNADPVTRRGEVSALRGQAQKYDSFSGTYYAPDSEDNYVDIVDFAQLVGQNIADGDVISAATAVSNVLSGGSQPLIIYKDDRSGIVSSWNSGYAGIGTIPVVFQRYNGLGIFYPPRTSGDPTSAYYNYITNQLFHITWNWGWTNFIANGIPPSLGGNEPPAMPGDLLISPLTPCGDVFEPNDLPGAASTMMVDEPITNLAFCQVGDEDWFVFTATAGAKYAIETYDLAQDTDTALSLYNSDGAMLVSDDNGNSAVSPGGSRITMTLGSGPYYIKANHVDAGAGNPSLAYSLKVTMIQPPKQIFVPSTMRASSTGW